MRSAKQRGGARALVLYCFQPKIRGDQDGAGDGWRCGDGSHMELVKAIQIPLPVLLAFVIFIAHIIVITDTGAGVPIFFPIFKRCMRPFKPTVAYERLKSKYLIS